jgi:hypothetical protein
VTEESQCGREAGALTTHVVDFRIINDIKSKNQMTLPWLAGWESVTERGEKRGKERKESWQMAIPQRWPKGPEVVLMPI